MATSGRSSASSAVVVAGLTVLLLAGCAGPAPTGPATPAGSSSQPSSPTSTAGMPTPSGTATPSGTGTVSTAKPCQVDLPDSWRSALDEGVVHPPKGTELAVALATSDGTTFAVVTGPGRHALEWQRGDEHGVVQDFGSHHAEWQVLGATWDGRHLAYRVDRSYSSFEDFALYVWDSQAMAGPVEVAHGEKDRDGELMQTPFVDPVLADGWLYWTQTRDADPDRTVLSGYRLSDGRTERLSRGYGRAPVRFGGMLVWSDSDKAGQTSSLRMIDLATHQRVEVPAALASVRGPYYLAGDAGTLAWVGGTKGRQVSVWRAGWPQPRVLVEAGDAPQFPRIAGDVVVYAGDEAMWAADLRSWSTAQVTPSYGGIYADGGPLVTVAYAPTSKGGASVQTLVDTDAAGPLGRAGC